MQSVFSIGTERYAMIAGLVWQVASQCALVWVRAPICAMEKAHLPPSFSYYHSLTDILSMNVAGATISRHLSPPRRNLLRLSILVADGAPAWKALAVSMLPSPQTWNLEAMRSMRPLGWNILLAGAVLG